MGAEERVVCRFCSWLILLLRQEFSPRRCPLLYVVEIYVDLARAKVKPTASSKTSFLGAYTAALSGARAGFLEAGCSRTNDARLFFCDEPFSQVSSSTEETKPVVARQRTACWKET
ncbi:unnamed protein product [Hapterophycus canaliculatus]